jgi:hypothetical protein
MGSRRWMALAGGLLLGASLLLYLLHYLLFRDIHHILIYLLGDLAFLPIEVFLVVIVLEGLLAAREKRALRQKMNMLIGMFFSDLGTELLGELTAAMQGKDEMRRRLDVNSSWTRRDYAQAETFVRAFQGEADVSALDLPRLRDLLVGHRDLLARLLANPNLLEHQEFTDLLWAVSHLREELVARPSLEDLPESDRKHLGGDVRRVYAHLTLEWLRYCAHLQSAYPYIFSIVVRTHPLQERPDAVVRG